MADNVVNIKAIEFMPPVPAPADYGPVILTNLVLINNFWPVISPLFQRCIDEAMHGEFTVDDLYHRACAGQISIMVIANDRTGEHPQLDVKIAGALEANIYPQYAAINILALGGANMHKLADEFWDMFRGWTLMNGAKTIEAMVSPRMARMLRPLGFKPVYQLVRCSNKD